MHLSSQTKSNSLFLSFFAYSSHSHCLRRNLIRDFMFSLQQRNDFLPMSRHCDCWSSKQVWIVCRRSSPQSLTTFDRIIYVSTSCKKCTQDDCGMEENVKWLFHQMYMGIVDRLCNSALPLTMQAVLVCLFICFILLCFCFWLFYVVLVDSFAQSSNNNEFPGLSMSNRVSLFAFKGEPSGEASDYGLGVRGYWRTFFEGQHFSHGTILET